MNRRTFMAAVGAALAAAGLPAIASAETLLVSRDSCVMFEVGAVWTYYGEGGRIGTCRIIAIDSNKGEITVSA